MSKNVDDVTVKREHGQFSVYDGGFLFEKHPKREDADKRAEQLRKSKRLLKRLETEADSLHGTLGWNEEDRQFFREYAGKQVALGI